jgi:MFS family permease
MESFVPLFRSLRNRSFALLWAGQTVSRLGDFVYELALAWWVLQKTGSALIMGLVLIFSTAPSVIFLLIGGAVVNRVPRLNFMLISDFGRAVITLSVAFLAFTGRLQVPYIFVASLFFGFVTAFFQPASAALISQIVPETDFSSANAITALSTNLSRVIGPILGAVIVGWLGPPSAFALNGLSFIISALLLIPLLFINIPTLEGPFEIGLLRDLRDGIGTVMSTPWLWISILIFSLINVTLSGPYSVAMPFLVGYFMKDNVYVLGLLYSIFPIGYIFGSIWLARYQRIHQRGLLMYLSLALAALMLALYGFHLPLWILIAAAFINGIALEFGNLTWAQLLQENVPGEQLGGVFSIDAMGSFGLLPVGLALAGWATGVFGPALVFMVGGILTAVTSLVIIVHPSIRALD